jgi:hypothetical protein
VAELSKESYGSQRAVTATTWRKGREKQGKKKQRKDLKEMDRSIMAHRTNITPKFRYETAPEH